MHVFDSYLQGGDEGFGCSGDYPARAADFVARSEPGSTVRLYAGRRPAFAGLMGELPLLIEPTRGVRMGVVPASGEIRLPIVVPAIPVATPIYAEVKRTLPGGNTE